MGTNGNKPEKFNLAFVHSALDDAGLSAHALRVYFHLVRRAGSDGECYPGLKSIARICRMNRKTVMAALEELEIRELVEVYRDLGKRNSYQLADPWEWYQTHCHADDESDHSPVETKSAVKRFAI
jgi:putative hemolysin